MAQMASDHWVFKFYKVRSPTHWPFEEILIGSVSILGYLIGPRGFFFIHWGYEVIVWHNRALLCTYWYEGLSVTLVLQGCGCWYNRAVLVEILCGASSTRLRYQCYRLEGVVFFTNRRLVFGLHSHFHAIFYEVFSLAWCPLTTKASMGWPILGLTSLL